MSSIFKGVGGVVVAGLAILLLVGAAWASIQIGGWLRQSQVDVNREVTQHSQEYIEAKRSLLVSLITDAEAATTAPSQRVAVVARFCEEYSYVDFDVPSIVDRFAAQECH